MPGTIDEKRPKARENSKSDKDELDMIHLNYKRGNKNEGFENQDEGAQKQEQYNPLDGFHENIGDAKIQAEVEVPNPATYEGNSEDVEHGHGPEVDDVDKMLADVRGGKRYWRVTWYLDEAHGAAEAYRWSWTAEELKYFVQLRLSSNIQRGDFCNQVHAEVDFVLSNFHQRRCKQFCKSEPIEISQSTANTANGQAGKHKRKYCACGLDNEYHSMEAMQNRTKKWSQDKSTEQTLPFNFGRLITSSTPKPYIRLDGLDTEPAQLWSLLIHYWKLRPPSMVISVTGGDVSELKLDMKLHRRFREGLRKSAMTTSAWLLTDGLSKGSTKEIGDIFQESKIGEHANNMSVIGVAPWGVITGRDDIAKHAIALHPPCSYGRSRWVSEEEEGKEILDGNSLDSNHTCYLLADDGQYGSSGSPSKLRQDLEKFITNNTTCALLGTNEVKTPLVILVVGGDLHTLPKLKFACSLGISMVVVDGSGPIANMCADVYKALESRFSRSNKRSTDWSPEEESVFMDLVQKYVRDEVIVGNDEIDQLREVMMSRYLMEIFGFEEGDINDLDKAILTAIFSGLTDMSAQLSLALAMDRCDITRNTIFIDSRRKELNEEKEVLECALHVALKRGRTEFVQLLTDRDYGADISLKSYLTINRLRELHQQNLKESHAMSSILRSLCLRGRNGSCNLDDAHLFPQVGRIIYWLMGNNYKLLYQHQKYSGDQGDKPPEHGKKYNENEALFHLFIWAVLGNRLELAEIFLSRTSCKIGSGLIAFRLLMKMSKKAKRLAELELSASLYQNAQYFQTLSINTLTELYDLNRQEAYVNLVAVLPFKWGKFITPISIARDAEAMRFMNHACCQTYINLIWMKNMNLSTPYWTLFPLFALVPVVNIPFILFDTESLRIGSYRKLTQDREVDPENIPQLNGTDITPSIVNLHDDIKESGVNKATKSPHFPNQPKQPNSLKYAWVCLKTYYTAPVNKFLFNLVSYLVFLGLFCRMLVSDLKPFKTWSDISISEWAVLTWEVALIVEESKQLFIAKSSGPLYDNQWYHFSATWRDTWTFGERFFFVMRLYVFNNWLADIWNVFDLVVHSCFFAAVGLRFGLDTIDFYVARIMYTVSMVLSFMRILRMGYIVQALGPRIMSIGKLMKDLVYFLVILAIFIFSFGIAFQALIDNGNVQPTWDLLADIVYRPYWQMYGELFLDDDGMGRPVKSRTCTSNYTYAQENRYTIEYCHDWVVPVFLGIFMLITNILLLNLLIAIFSHSFDTIESEAEKIWRFNMYGLVHEYYHQSWIPPPLTLVANIFTFLAFIYRRLRYKCCKKIGRMDCCARCRRKYKDYSYFRQDERMRDCDLETKAFLRGLKSASSYEEPQSVDSAIQSYAKRLQAISTDLHDIKQMTAGGARANQNEKSSKHKRRNPTRSPSMHDSSVDKKLLETTSTEVKQVKATIQQVTERVDIVSKQVDTIQKRLDTLANSMDPIIAYLTSKMKEEQEKVVPSKNTDIEDSSGHHFSAL